MLNEREKSTFLSLGYQKTKHLFTNVYNNNKNKKVTIDVK